MQDVILKVLQKTNQKKKIEQNLIQEIISFFHFDELVNTFANLRLDLLRDFYKIVTKLSKTCF